MVSLSSLAWKRFSSLLFIINGKVEEVELDVVVSTTINVVTTTTTDNLSDFFHAFVVIGIIPQFSKHFVFGLLF